MSRSPILPIRKQTVSDEPVATRDHALLEDDPRRAGGSAPDGVSAICRVLAGLGRLFDHWPELTSQAAELERAAAQYDEDDR